MYPSCLSQTRFRAHATIHDASLYQIHTQYMGIVSWPCKAECERCATTVAQNGPVDLISHRRPSPSARSPVNLDVCAQHQIGHSYSSHEVHERSLIIHFNDAVTDGEAHPLTHRASNNNKVMVCFECIHLTAMNGAIESQTCACIFNRSEHVDELLVNCG